MDRAVVLARWLSVTLIWTVIALGFVRTACAMFPRGPDRSAPLDLNNAATVLSGVLLPLAVLLAFAAAVAHRLRGGRAPGPNAAPRTTERALLIAVAGYCLCVLLLAVGYRAPLDALWLFTHSSAESHVLLWTMIPLAAAAAASGGRPAWATGVAAAPLVLISQAGVVANTSVALTLLSLVLAVLGTGLVALVVGLATRSPHWIWWTASAFAVLLVAPPILLGVATPTEAIGFAAFFVTVAGVIVHGLIDRGRIASLLRVGTPEIAAGAAVFMFGQILLWVGAFTGLSGTLGEGLVRLPEPVLAATAMLAAALLSYGAGALLAVVLVIWFGFIAFSAPELSYPFASAIILAALAGTALTAWTIDRRGIRPAPDAPLTPPMASAILAWLLVAMLTLPWMAGLLMRLFV